MRLRPVGSAPLPLKNANAASGLLSRSTRAVINQNFMFGVCFIIIGLTLAAFGKIGPIVAAILHNVGSLIVIFNSARLVRKGEELEHYHPEQEKLAGPGKPAPQLTPKLA